MLQKTKTKSFIKLAVATVKQSAPVNLIGHSKRSQKNAKNLSGIAIVIRVKLVNTAGKQSRTLTGVRRKLLIGKTG